MTIYAGLPRKQYGFVFCVGILILLVFFTSQTARPQNGRPTLHSSSGTHAKEVHAIHNCTLPTPVITTILPTPTKEAWEFDVARDDRNYGLTEDQCDATFPSLWRELDRAVEVRKENDDQKITGEDIDLDGHGSGFMRVLIYDRQIYIVDTRFNAAEYDLPRALALLHSMNRAIIATQEPIPNIEFSIALTDKFDDPGGKFPVWVLARRESEHYKWVMPDFGYWSWTLMVVGGYTDIRSNMRANEPTWDEKVPKALWRGDTNPNPIRPLLVEAAKDKDWSDVKRVGWKDAAHLSDEDKDLSVSIPDHCLWQYLIHTEGNSYSGRGKHLLNCESVSIVHKPEWIEPHTHLFVDEGDMQNVISVQRDFTDLDVQMTEIMAHPAKAQFIVANSVKTFRDRYLTPAAMACYWRKMFKTWAEVSFEPELWTEVETPDGKKRKRTRGREYESYVADFTNAPPLE